MSSGSSKRGFPDGGAIGPHCGRPAHSLGSKGDYGRELFGRYQFERTAEIVLPSSQIAAFANEGRNSLCSVAGGKGRPAKELIVSGL